MPTHTRTRGIRASNWAAPANRGDPAHPQWTEPAQARLSPTYGRTRMPIDWHARTPGPESTRRMTQGLDISRAFSPGLEPETNRYHPEADPEILMIGVKI